MHNLFTTLGEARAIGNIYSSLPPILDPTKKAYEKAYDRFAAGTLHLEAAAHPAAARFLKAAIRYGTLKRLHAAADRLERALKEADEAATAIAGKEVKECLSILERYRRGFPGRRRPRLRRSMENA